MRLKAERPELAGIGTFNNLNPYVDKGILPYYIDPRIYSITHETLMEESEDELASYYGKLVKSIQVAEDYSWVAYELRQ